MNSSSKQTCPCQAGKKIWSVNFGQSSHQDCAYLQASKKGVLSDWHLVTLGHICIIAMPELSFTLLESHTCAWKNIAGSTRFGVFSALLRSRLYVGGHICRQRQRGTHRPQEAFQPVG